MCRQITKIMTNPTKVTPSPPDSSAASSSTKSRRSSSKSVAVSFRRLLSQSLTRQDNDADATAHSSSSYLSSLKKKKMQGAASASDIANSSAEKQRGKTFPILRRQPSIKYAAKRCSVDTFLKKASGGYVPPAPHPLLVAEESQSDPSSRRESVKCQGATASNLPSFQPANVDARVNMRD